MRGAQLLHLVERPLVEGDDVLARWLGGVAAGDGERAARETIALYAVLLVATTLLFVPFGLAGRYYLGAATALGAAFLALSLRGLRAGARFDANRWAKHVFAFSVIYLPALLVALLVARA